MSQSLRFRDIPLIVAGLYAFIMVRLAQAIAKGFRSRSRFDLVQPQDFASKYVTVGGWGWVIISMCAVTMVFIMTQYKNVPAFSDPAEFYAILLTMGMGLGLVPGYKHELGAFFKTFPLTVGGVFVGVIAFAIGVSVFGGDILSAFSLPLSNQPVPVVSIGWVAMFYFSGGGAAETAFFQLFLFNGFMLALQRFGVWGFLAADAIVSGFFDVYHFGVQFFFPNLWPITPLNVWEFFVVAFLVSFFIFNPIFWFTKRFDAIAWGHGLYDLIWTLMRFYGPAAQAGWGLVGF